MTVSEPDLNELFPNLRGVLDNWDKFNGNDGALTQDGQRGQVTDEDLARYFQSRLSGGPYRAPINPAVSGQVSPPSPEFANNGRAAPPTSMAVVEEPDGGQVGPSTEPTPPVPPTTEPATPPATPEPTPTAPPEPGAPEPAPTAPVEPPGTPVPTPPAPVPPEPTQVPPVEPGTETGFVTIGGQQVPRSRLEAWAEFDQLLTQDEQLRNLILAHVQGRVPPSTQATQVPTTAPAPAQQFQLSEEDLQDPTVRALYQMYQTNTEELNRIRAQSEYATNLALSSQQREHAEIVNAAGTAFQKQYQIDDNTMELVRSAAARTGAVQTFMNGMDPITGVPVKPDPYRAVERALEIGYWMVPELREAEYSRRTAQAQARAQEDAERRRKLAGVSGASGSVPRTQPAPRTDSERRQALLAEVGEMMQGSWTER